jgi:radical SAM superfamily enzyme YgiQ (UPF0313 family)
VRIVIVEPCQHDPRYDVRSLTPGLGPVVVATLLRDAGHHVEVQSELVEPLHWDSLRRADLVGISVATYNACRGYDISAQLSQPVVFGGMHASLMPEECLRHGAYAVTGDGMPVVALARLVAAGNPLPDALGRVPNLAWRHQDTVVRNPRSPQPADVIPDFGLVRGWRRLGWRRLARIPLLVHGSRGCPHGCDFCAIRAVYPEVRHVPPSRLRQAVEAVTADTHPVQRFLPRFLWITDDNFFADKRWAREALHELSQVDTGFQLVLQARPEVAEDPEMLRLLRAARISRVYVGMESLDQAALDGFHKRQTVEQVERCVGAFSGAGIGVHGLFVFGGDQFRPGDGVRVADWAVKHGLSGLLVQPLTPWPGTALFSRLEAEGRILSRDWRDYNGRVVFRPLHMTPAALTQEVYACYDRVYGTRRLLNTLLHGQPGTRAQVVGEGVIRRMEGVKARRYARDVLERGARS